MRTAIPLALLSLLGCRSLPAPPPGQGSGPPPWEADNPVRPLPAAPLGITADYSSLPFRVTPEKVRLGRWLFFDRRLSADGTISCASCHQPEHAFSEERATSMGIRGQLGRRKAPPILNVAWPISPVFFWDGRATSLVEQAEGPMFNPTEMGNTHEGVALTVRSIAGYRPYFRRCFGDGRVDAGRVAEAIAAYEATRLSGDSPYDRFDAGEERALSPLALRGRDLFFGRARCSACHLGQNFTDGQFHNLGVGWRAPPPGRPASEGFRDLGRYEVTHREQDIGAFKTPTLRDLSRRAPYMHDGSVRTLREVVELYRRGGEKNPWLAPELAQARIEPGDVDALVAFLESLDGTGYEDRPPTLFPR